MTPTTTKPGVVWMKRNWNLRQNPFPSGGVARLGGNDDRENGLLFRPEVQQEKVDQAINNFVLGAAYQGLKFGYLWSVGGGLGGDVRGYGKSSMLQFLVEAVNDDFGRGMLIGAGLEETDADEHPLVAVLSSFDMANARSLSAVFFEAARYACRFHVGDNPTLATRLYRRLVERTGTDDHDRLVSAVNDVANNVLGRTLGPAIPEFVSLLCRGDQMAVGEYMESVKAGARARVGAANYLATFLLFAKAAGIAHVLLGCDQLEDFAATTTTKAKRSVEVERFRDYVLELQPMADMLTCVVTLHPRAEQAIGEMWRLADLPNFAPDRAENESRVVVLEPIEDHDRAKSLLQPYLDAARTSPAPEGQPFAPFTDDAVNMLLDRSNGKPRDLLLKAFALIEQGAKRNWDQIDGERAAGVLDSLTAPDAEFSEPMARVAAASATDDLWT
jgi:hypothetical protein